MEIEKRLWAAILLSMGIVFLWNYLFFPPTPPPKGQKIQNEIIADSPSKNIISDDVINDTNQLVVAPSDTIISLVNGRNLDMTLSEARFEFQETGAVLSSLELKSFNSVRLDLSSRPVNLSSPPVKGAGNFSVAMDDADRSGLSTAIWSGETLPERGEVVFSLRPQAAEIPAGVLLKKTFRFSKETPYTGEFVLSITNQTSQSVALATAKLDHPLQSLTSAGSLILHVGPGLGRNHPAKSYEEQYLVSGVYGAQGKMEQAVLEKGWTHSLFGVPEAPREIDWAALQNRYFTLALAPVDFKVDADFRLNVERELELRLMLPAFSLEPGQEKSFVFRVFAGPKETTLLGSFNPHLRPLDGMEPSIFPSQISFARWIIPLLGMIQGWVGNWGLAIVILTFAIRALLYPLSYYQFKSMAKMQKLKPKIDALQARYANDKERLQRELMNVYREAGVNPLGGCLPILFQMPILVGLFIALQNSIVLRGVPFVWWVKDLSIPDSVFWFLGIPLNPLPIAMAVTMIIQQKLTPTPTADPNQKQMFTIMTVVMTVLFYNFPSGLTLYWLTQNVLSIAQQYYMMKRKED